MANNPLPPHPAQLWVASDPEESPGQGKGDFNNFHPKQLGSGTGLASCCWPSETTLGTHGPASPEVSLFILLAAALAYLLGPDLCLEPILTDWGPDTIDPMYPDYAED